MLQLNFAAGRQSYQEAIKDRKTLYNSSDRHDGRV